MKKSEHSDFVFYPDNGSLIMPNIETLSYKPEGCELHVDTPVGHFTDKVLEAVAAGILQNLFYNVKKQRGELDNE